LAFVNRNPVEWETVSRKERDDALQAGRITNSQWAQTGDGRILIQKQSKTDFEGGGRNGRGFAVLFDAKQTGAASIPLANFREHQVKSLSRAARCGVIAGFMIRFTRTNRVFFAPAPLVEECFVKSRLQSGRKSISTEMLLAGGKEIPVKNELVDWLGVLAADK
jgi:recombination protein U